MQGNFAVGCFFHRVSLSGTGGLVDGTLSVEHGYADEGKTGRFII